MMVDKILKQGIMRNIEIDHTKPTPQTLPDRRHHMIATTPKRMRKTNAEVPAHVAAIAEAQRQALAERMAAQAKAKAEAVVVEPQQRTYLTSKKARIRAKHYRARTAA